MKLSSRPRRPSKLSDSLHHQLNMYALAASAVGIGSLALSQVSQAKVVYTPADEQVSGKLDIDLNHDGIPDFMIASWGGCGSTECWFDLDAQGLSPNNGIAYKLDQSFRPALALGKGGVIDSRRKFVGPATMFASWAGSTHRKYVGYWGNVTNRYLGLEFQINGETHYGWARFNVKRNGTVAVLTGYAYETIPNKGIIAGKTKGPDVITVPPGSLGQLALGRK